MPNIPGRLKYKGYISPAPGDLNKSDKELLARVYGGCRTNNPGEVPEYKAKCAKIAWNMVNKRK